MGHLQKKTSTSFQKPLNMAISNELSSDVAVAILANKKSPHELKQLKEIILEVHSALQKMSEETRDYRFKRRSQERRKRTNA